MADSKPRRTRPPDGSDLEPDWRARELRTGGAYSLLATVVIAIGWAAFAGTDDRRLDDLGIYTGMAAALPAALGAFVAARRKAFPRETGAVLIRFGYGLFAMLLTALAQLLVIALLSPFEELVWVAVGAAAGCLLISLPGSILALTVGGSVLWASRLPPGSSPLRRALMGLMFVLVLLVGVGAVLGSSASVHSRDFIGAVLVLLGLHGETESAPWMWTARVGTVALIAVVWAIVRTMRSESPDG